MRNRRRCKHGTVCSFLHEEWLIHLKLKIHISRRRSA